MQYINNPPMHHLIKAELDRWSELGAGRCCWVLCAVRCCWALLLGAGRGARGAGTDAWDGSVGRQQIPQHRCSPWCAAPEKSLQQPHAATTGVPQRLTRACLRHPPAADAAREAGGGAAAGQPAAKRAKVDAPAASSAAASAPRPAGIPLMQHPAALAAMAGGRPPLPPGVALPAGMVPQALTAAQASAAAQMRLQQQLATKAQFQPIVRCVAAPAGYAAAAFAAAGLRQACLCGARWARLACRRGRRAPSLQGCRRVVAAHLAEQQPTSPLCVLLQAAVGG